jgi:hypothetical protein
MAAKTGLLFENDRPGRHNCGGADTMRRIRMRHITAALLVAGTAMLPSHQAAAQFYPLAPIVGGAVGAGVGAAVTGGRVGGAIVGGVIGAAAATALTFDPRPNGYYWYDSRCWYRYPNGEYRLVPRRYCGPY